MQHISTSIFGDIIQLLSMLPFILVYSQKIYLLGKAGRIYGSPSALLRPYLNHCIQSWSPHLEKDVEL